MTTLSDTSILLYFLLDCVSKTPVNILSIFPRVLSAFREHPNWFREDLVWASFIEQVGVAEIARGIDSVDANYLSRFLEVSCYAGKAPLQIIAPPYENEIFFKTRRNYYALGDSFRKDKHSYRLNFSDPGKNVKISTSVVKKTIEEIEEVGEIQHLKDRIFEDSQEE